jgi:opacity protein-like surface antigen
LQLAAASFAAAAGAAVAAAAAAAAGSGSVGVLTAEEVDELRADAQVTCDV